MAGRPKKPVDLLVFEGKTHLTKSEIEERKKTEVIAKTDKIHPPEYLPKKLQEKFKKIAEQLLDIGIMTNLDCEALARYVIAEEQYQRISKKLIKPSSMKDLAEYGKSVKTQQIIFNQVRAAANDLGLTISSRCKLTVPQKQDEKPKSEGQKRFADRL